MNNSTKFPYESETERLHKYEVNHELLEGDHFEAFTIEAEAGFSQRYNKLRYIVANMNGLVAKVSADMLFGEDVVFEADQNQQFIDALVYSNKLNVQLWESAIQGSALGDIVFKVRVEDGEIKIDNIDPAIYFPHVNSKNPRMTPKVQELAWVDIHKTPEGEKRFLIREIHTAGLVEVKIHVVTGGENFIQNEVDVLEYNNTYGTNYAPTTQTNIDKPLLVHIKNMTYEGSKEFFGESDFKDMSSLQFELNNRLTKMANILDKHSDPILAVPDGVLDEYGRVKKEALQMVELGDDGQVPQYIVWNASLDNAFKEIDKITEMLFMVSEISPDVLGLGKGQAESGRALKMRLIRTLSKIKRKQKYYTQGLKEIFEICQMLSMNNAGVGVSMNGDKLSVNSIETINVKFSDGLVNDTVEETDLTIKRVDAGLLSKQSAIMYLDGKTQEEAVQELTEIKSESGDFTSILDTLSQGSPAPTQPIDQISQEQVLPQ